MTKVVITRPGFRVEVSRTDYGTEAVVFGAAGHKIVGMPANGRDLERQRDLRQEIQAEVFTHPGFASVEESFRLIDDWRVG